MAKATWTDYKLKILKNLIGTHTHAEIAEILGFTTLAVKSKATTLRLTKMKRFTSEEIEYVRQHYADTLTLKIARELNRSESSIYELANRLKIEKSEAFRNSTESGRLSKLMIRGYGYRFKKGAKAYNKGKKQSQYMSAEAIERSKASRFKKGQQPHNTLTDGAERVRVSKGRPYVWVRVGLGVWVLKHRLVWEQHNGPIEKGYNVQFKDGDQLNCAIENLYLIKRNQQINQNTIHRYPNEIKAAIKTLSKLKRKIKEYEKQDLRFAQPHVCRAGKA